MNDHLLYEGSIIHRRHLPRTHQFKYPLFQFLLDLDHLSNLANVSPLLGFESYNYLSYYRSKYFINNENNFKVAVLSRLGITSNYSNYKVTLLTSLSYLGYCFNPISLYFIYEHGVFKSLIAEVTNTPWHERHLYILDAPVLSKPPIYHFEANKCLHVSPFMTMDYKYEFKLKLTDNEIMLHIRNIHDEIVTFDATLNMVGTPLTKCSLHGLLRKYPLHTHRTVFLIHWHALKLWLKGIAIQPHPKTTKCE